MLYQDLKVLNEGESTSMKVADLVNRYAKNVDKNLIEYNEFDEFVLSNCLYNFGKEAIVNVEGLDEAAKILSKDDFDVQDLKDALEVYYVPDVVDQIISYDELKMLATEEFGEELTEQFYKVIPEKDINELIDYINQTTLESVSSFFIANKDTMALFDNIKKGISLDKTSEESIRSSYVDSIQAVISQIRNNITDENAFRVIEKMLNIAKLEEVQNILLASMIQQNAKKDLEYAIIRSSEETKDEEKNIFEEAEKAEQSKNNNNNNRKNNNKNKGKNNNKNEAKEEEQSELPPSLQ